MSSDGHTFSRETLKSIVTQTNAQSAAQLKAQETAQRVVLQWIATGVPYRFREFQWLSEAFTENRDVMSRAAAAGSRQIDSGKRPIIDWFAYMAVIQTGRSGTVIEPSDVL